MWRLLVILTIVLYVTYYISVIYQFLFGIVQFTNRKMKFYRALIPFYFWIAPTNEKIKNTHKVKPIIKKIKRYD